MREAEGDGEDMSEIRFNTDMHLHTFFSDGLFSPTDIVKRAKEQNLDTIAITDHDGIDGVREAQIAAEALGGIQVMTGIEFSTIESEGLINKTSGASFRNLEIHMLGYNFDMENAALRAELDKMKKNRRDRNDRLLSALNDMGYAITQEDLYAENGHDYIGKPVFARVLVKKGYTTSFKEAIEGEKFLGSPEAKAVRKEKIEVKRAIELINGAGGMAVCAHPVKTKNLGQRGTAEFFENLEALIAKLKAYGMKGLECFHTDHKAEEEEWLVSMAEKYKLHITRGSDFHGDK